MKIYMVVRWACSPDDYTEIHGHYDNKTIAELACRKKNENSSFDFWTVDEYELHISRCPSTKHGDATGEDSEVLSGTTLQSESSR